METRGMLPTSDVTQRTFPHGDGALSRRAFFSLAAGAGALLASACAAHEEEVETPPAKPRADRPKPKVYESLAAELMDSLTIEQKIAQMIVPSIRTWNEGDVVELSSAVAGLAGALRRHQYGGILLYDQNMKDTEQTVRLVSRLQANNAVGARAQNSGVVPYFVMANHEGGAVSGIPMGTRGTGSMAIAATHDAEGNARRTGELFGEELSALGINVDLGPCFDVVFDLDDPGLSTRMFSDDPHTVVDLCKSFAKGLEKSDVIAAYKHFPGAGNGGSSPTASKATLEQLWNDGLYVFATLMDDDVDMTLVSSVSFPSFDDEHILADEESTACWPACMSSAVVTQILRSAMRFEGVVLTDVLDSDRFQQAPVPVRKDEDKAQDESQESEGDAPDGEDSEGESTSEENSQEEFEYVQLLPGEVGSANYLVNVAVECINAGCDMLLVPMDLSGRDRIVWYDDFIRGLASVVKRGIIPSWRIDKSVQRILELKERRGILKLDVSGGNVRNAVAKARQVVGSIEHHNVEREIAEQALTLLKNYDALPVPGFDSNVVIVGRTTADFLPITNAIKTLQDDGFVDSTALITDLVTGEESGHYDSKMRIYLGRYYDEDEGLVYSDELQQAIGAAKYVICLSSMQPTLSSLQNDDDCVRGIASALVDTHEAKGHFVLLSDNLPVDAARFEKSDAIVCCYLREGFDVEMPPAGWTSTMPAINENVPSALRAIFGAVYMPGTLPITIPLIEESDKGTWNYSPYDIAFPRGSNV